MEAHVIRWRIHHAWFAATPQMFRAEVEQLMAVCHPVNSLDKWNRQEMRFAHLTAKVLTDEWQPKRLRASAEEAVLRRTGREKVFLSS